MKPRAVATLAGSLMLALLLVLPASLLAYDGGYAHARLSGFQEVPAISTMGSGWFKAMYNPDDKMVYFKLFYEDTEASVGMAHIHFGQKGVVGGISVFLCNNMDTSMPMCPASGMLTGSFGAADVIGPSDQGIEPGEFREFLRAFKAGKTYVNVHTPKWPSGEIRGQIMFKKVRFPIFGDHFSDDDFDMKDMFDD